MNRQVQIYKRAALQVRKQAEWWEVNRPAAPGAVAEDFAAAIRLIAEQPGVGSKYAGARTPGVRRLYLGRLSCFVYYRADAHALRVLAFWSSIRAKQPVI